jgi:ribonuclease Z
LIHDATFADDRADRAAKTAHSTARQAAEVANRAGADRLALVHLSSRYAGRTDDHEAQARAAFAGDPEDAFVPDDGRELEIPYPDG